VLFHHKECPTQRRKIQMGHRRLALGLTLCLVLKAPPKGSKLQLQPTDERKRLRLQQPKGRRLRRRRQPKNKRELRGQREPEPTVELQRHLASPESIAIVPPK
jgi:hypothetical protein